VGRTRSAPLGRRGGALAIGARVEGTVCCGLTGIGKGCTIRWGR